MWTPSQEARLVPSPNEQRHASEPPWTADASPAFRLLDALDEGFLLTEVLYDGDRPLDLLYLHANPAAVALLGGDWAGRRLSEVNPDAEAHWLETWDRVARTGQAERAERHGAASGRWFDYLVFPGEGPRLVATIFRDITERRGTEEALRSAEARQSFLLRLGDRMRSLSDPLEMQAEAMRLLGQHLGLSRAGYAEDEGDGQHIRLARNYCDGVPGLEGTYRYDDYGPELLRAFREGRTVVRSDIANDPRLSEAEKAAHRALELGATVNIPLLKDGRLVAVLFLHAREARVWTDEEVRLAEAVAERTWSSVQRAIAVAAMRDSEERLRLAKEAADLGVHDFDPATGKVRWDERVRELWGVGPDEPVDYATFERGLHPDDRAPTRAALDAALDPAGSGLFRHEYRVIHRTDGRVRTILATGRTAFEEGRAVRLVGTVQDITEQRRAERAMHEHESRQLEVERRAREAAEAFVAVMSHELRTPVTSIYGVAKLLERDPGSPRTPELIHDVADESERLIRIIEDLLVLSGVGSGHIPLSHEPVLVQHAIGEAVGDARRRFRDAVIELDVPAGLPPVLGDPTAIRQILRNLLSNACKYAGRSGPITLAASASGAWLDVAVLDRGPGPGDDPDGLFAMYYRAPHTARLAGGTGIGLYVARELATAMDGRVEARTREGGGAVFSVALPLAEADSDDVPSETNDPGEDAAERGPGTRSHAPARG
jgi:PAS domain S-box-containing protein